MDAVWPNSRALDEGVAGAGNMPTTCAAVFNPKVWTCTAPPREIEISKLHRWRDYQSRRCALRNATRRKATRVESLQ